MKVQELALSGVKLINLDLLKDDRGFFTERFKKNKFEEWGLPSSFVQDNFSRSQPGVIRGMHFQFEPAQGKLIGVTRGRICDVVIDLRFGSPSFGKHLSVELSGDTMQMIWVPAGFAHGFCVLDDQPADVLYKVDAEYSAQGEGGLHWNDHEIQIPWPINTPKVSKRDQALPSFAEYKNKPLFRYQI